MKNACDKNLTLSRWDSIRYIYSVMFSSLDKVIIEQICFHEWMLQQLKDTKNEMDIVAGELAVGINNDEIVNTFKEAINSGKRINIFFGPNVYIPNPKMINGKFEEQKNELYEYLKVTKKSNLHSYATTRENQPMFHFVRNGRNVCIEQPHLSSEALDENVKTFIISNSILWYNRLKILFKNIIADKTLLQDLEQVPTKTKSQLEEWQNDPKYKDIMDRILQSRKAAEEQVLV